MHSGVDSCERLQVYDGPVGGEGGAQTGAAQRCEHEGALSAARAEAREEERRVGEEVERVGHRCEAVCGESGGGLGGV